MAVSIRLARQGSKKRPFYRIIAADSRRARDGRFIEQLGHYNPVNKDLKLDTARYERWISVGANASATVQSLYKKAAKAAS